MKKEFIPYEQALALKELGFDELCLGRYDPLKVLVTISKPNNNSYYKGSVPSFISAPLYQQAFRWFREKYNLHSEPYTIDMGAIEYCFQIRDLYSEKYVYDNFVGAGGSYHGTFFTPEEAELECLKKLIEITNEKI